MDKPEPPDRNRHWRLLLNGKSAGDQAVRDAVEAMRGRGVTLDVRVLWEAGDARRYVDEAIADAVGTVIAGGGDGSLSEVAGALAEHDLDAEGLPALALLPLGTANDFAAAALIPSTADAALELVYVSAAQPIDLLRIDGDAGRHWCANLATGGFGTQVTVNTDERLKKVLGGLAYLITGIASLGQVEPIQARIRGAAVAGADFDWEGGFIALGIGNGRQAGGGQVLCPDAVIDDGMLELTIIPELERALGRTVASLLGEGGHAALDRIAQRRQLSWVEVRAAEKLTLNLDGEPVESTRFRVECVARRVRMHLPSGCPLLRLPGNPLPVSDGDEAPGLVPSLLPA